METVESPVRKRMRTFWPTTRSEWELCTQSPTRHRSVLPAFRNHSEAPRTDAGRFSGYLQKRGLPLASLLTAASRPRSAARGVQPSRRQRKRVKSLGDNGYGRRGCWRSNRLNKPVCPPAVGGRCPSQLAPTSARGKSDP